MPTPWIRLAAALVAATLPVAAAAQKKTAAEHTVEDFFRLPEYSELALSPDGSKLSALAPLKGRNNLVILDLKTRKPNVITSFDALDVAEIFWINNERLCFRVTDGQEVTGQLNYKGTFCINHDGSDQRNFSNVGMRDSNQAAWRLRLIFFLARAYDDSPNVYVSARVRSADSQDVYRLNTITSRYDLLTGEVPPPGFVRRWVLDRNNVPRVAVCQPERVGNAALVRSVWHRDSAGGKWEKIAEMEIVGDNWHTGDAFEPMAFDYDNTTLYVSANNGRDKRAVYKYDTKAKKLGELMFENPLVDITGGLVFHHGQKKLLGIRYEADRPVTQWLDPAIGRLQRQIDATFPKTRNFLGLPAEDDRRALIFSHSDVDPGTYHLMDRTKPAIETLVKTRGWINPDAMPERKFIQYKARDGRTIPAYLTLPRGVEAKNLPLIVNIHGGPWTRTYGWIEWGRPEAAFFASRGYAVLEPEPRGSTGWGKEHFLVSFKQWGQAMQDDITDGALHLATEGIVDKGRMCLHGGSYGGYATAMGLVKDPDLWRCGSPFVAVTDLFLFQGVTYSDMNDVKLDFFQTDFKKMVGDSSADKDMFTKYSPNLQADKIKAPIFLTMGSNDVRVPQVHGDKFESNLRAAGKKVEYVVYAGEGHGYNKAENVYDFYRRLEKFFAENLKK
jgi:dienelactone hydrolase